VNTNPDMTREASLWPFLHGELDTAAKSELRQALDAQPELQQRLEACRRADRLLNAYFLSDAASSASSEDTLVERAMQAWDSERRRRARPHGWPGWGGVLLKSAVALGAAAAALMLWLSPDTPTEGHTGWAPPAFIPLALRGADTSGHTPPLTRQDAVRCQDALAQALARALDARAAALPRGWTAALRLHELPRGALSITVLARDSDARTVAEWSGAYSNIDAFLQQADASADRLAEDLAAHAATRQRRQGAP